MNSSLAIQVHGKDIDINGKPVRFYENVYLAKPEECQKLIDLCGVDTVLATLTNGRLNNVAIETMVAEKTYYQDKGGFHLFTFKSAAFERLFEPLIPLNGIEALKTYGLDKLLIAAEKGYIRPRSRFGY